MLASGAFASTGHLGNSTGSFSEESFSINAADSNSKQISFVFTPSADLKPEDMNNTEILLVLLLLLQSLSNIL